MRSEYYCCFRRRLRHGDDYYRERTLLEELFADYFFLFFPDKMAAFISTSSYPRGITVDGARCLIYSGKFSNGKASKFEKSRVWIDGATQSMAFDIPASSARRHAHYVTSTWRCETGMASLRSQMNVDSFADKWHRVAVARAIRVHSINFISLRYLFKWLIFIDFMD